MFKLLLQLIFVVVFLEYTDNAAVDMFKNNFKTQNDQVVGLYSITDDVEILTIHNFKSSVYGSKNAWLIEFYNSYCGFCQRFAPSWKEFATTVKDWKNRVAVGAIDCANEENNPLCREFEIMGYPTLRYFHEQYIEGPKNLGIQVSAKGGADDHKVTLLETIVAEQKEGRGKQYPDISPYLSKHTDELFTDVNVKYVFLVVQEPGSIVGQTIALDLAQNPNVRIRYATKENTDLLNSLNIQNVPAVVVFDSNRNREVLTILDNPKNTILDYLQSKNINVKNSQNSNEDNVETRIEPVEDAQLEKIKRMGDVVFQKDLETALRYSLRKEVSRTKEITGYKLAALRNYLSVLIKYFPFGKYGQAFLMDLKYYVDGRDMVRGKDIFDKVKAAEKLDSQVFSTPEGWIGCRGSTKTFRGYPCGLWKMFHYLSMQHYEKNLQNPDAQPSEVLEAMHGYIKEFFGCTDCSQHFQEMAKRRKYQEVASVKDAVLWLWSAHNEVNNRLHGDATEDPKFPKIQFPSQQNCPQCRLNDDSFVVPEVFNYLKTMYGVNNVRYIDSDTRILHLGLEGPVSSGSAPNFFQTLDTKARISCKIMWDIQNPNLFRCEHS
ncbi:sulfhydryl oxidase 1-like isoform X1 [Aethina tumida]|uniref:sulfhydryl oxidase 1-like isoform X1 n=1 Tax=Aethina tumida TaxID=116153 RepID=UPI002149300A|nr:sulfhydryl oxidase 1-like isoform X1 [Aethina tumida]